MPAPLTTFIGREKERAEIIKHIKKHRLVTLTGPGGVGKTGLSFSVGERVGGDYANGIWLVELAALTGPVLLPQAVVAVLGLTAQTNTSSTALLIDYLRPKTILLILDNCEHLLEASAKLADTLLKNCPGLKILATSRETLQIPGEATYRDPSLEVPSLKQLPDPLSGYDSVRLFEERAQLAQPDFSLTSGNISAIAQICGQLDGIPLAIELAAAQVNRFSTEQIAAKLTESFNVLTGGSRTVLPHQQTLRASIEWSWALLSAPERSLLQRLSIFRGGWSLEAAETVCGVSAFQPKEDKESSRQQSESLDLFDSLTQLVNKSLVAVESHTETRYRILETIRQYAGEKLLSSGDGEATRNRHLHFYLGFAEHANAKLRSADQQTWQNRLQVEPDNCRAAQGWAPVSGQLTSVSAGYGR